MSVLKIVSALTMIAAFGFAAPASAACTKVAQNCMKNGGTREVCFGQAYKAAQKAPYIYVGPYSGKSFQCHPKK